MSTIRILEPRDIPAAADLFARVYPQQRWRSRSEFQYYVREVLFENPWRDPELPSWIAEDGDRISGWYAVMPRRMRLHGRPIRVAVACQYMVDPGHRQGLTALQLAKACLSGPQDLTLADGANDESRRMWTAVAGSAPLLNSLHWTRPLRPARFLLSLLERRAAVPALVAHAARPLGAVADAFAARLGPNRFLREDPDRADERLDAQTMLAHLPEVLRGYALQPEYDAASLAWLLDEAARKTGHGSLRARAVRDGDGRLAGWYLHYVRAGGVSEVLQVAAADGSFDCVLKRLLADASRQGAVAVHGRLEPRFARELSERHCWMRTDGTWMLVHSRHPEVLHAIHQGEAFLSRLEGEWWMRFMGEKNGAST
ncbi:MAG: GNAT family N-acetyltransferase [Burkholderiales bacterium]